MFVPSRDPQKGPSGLLMTEETSLMAIDFSRLLAQRIRLERTRIEISRQHVLLDH